MRVLVYSAKPYDERFFNEANGNNEHELTFLETKLTADTAALADGHQAICAFVNDTLDAPVLERLSDRGVQAIALRCAGFNNVDVAAAKRLGIPVVRVPAYSPHAVAEHTVGLALALNRQLHRAYGRVRDGNFSLNGLLGFDFHGKTVGVIGTGQIGAIFARILHGFGCSLRGYDMRENPECVALGMEYVSLDRLYAESDLISLHCPLTPETHHLIDADAINRMKRGVTLINTSRGAVVDTAAVIDGLKRGQIGRLGLDVYEEEGDVFFEDLSNRAIPDDTLARLLTFPNVMITGHQAFFTVEAMTSIAETTLGNLACLERGDKCENAV